MPKQAQMHNLRATKWEFTRYNFRTSSYQMEPNKSSTKSSEKGDIKWLLQKPVSNPQSRQIAQHLDL